MRPAKKIIDNKVESDNKTWPVIGNGELARNLGCCRMATRGEK